MAWGERTACRATASAGSSGVTFSLGATPSAGDAVVVAIAVEGTPGSVNCAGCGATWVRLVVNSNAPSLTYFVGYNADGASSSVTISNLGSNAFAVVATAFFGLRTDSSIVGNSGTGATGTSTTSQATADITSVAGPLIGAVAHRATADDVAAPTWSGGGSNTRVGVKTQGGDTGSQVAALDYTTAAVTTEHVTWTSGTSGAWSARLVELLTPPPVNIAGTAHGVGAASGSLGVGRPVSGSSHGVGHASGAMVVPPPRIGLIAVTDDFDRSRNLLAAADPSFEVGVSQLTQQGGGVVAITQSADVSVGWPFDGLYSAKVVTDGGDYFQGIGWGNAFTPAVGVPYLISVRVKGPAGAKIRLSVTNFTNFIARSNGTDTGVTLTGGVNVITATGIREDGAGGACNIYVDTGDLQQAITFYVDAVQVEVATNEWATVYGRDPSFAGGGTDSWSSGFASGPNNVTDPDGSGGKAITVTRTVSDSDSTNAFATGVTLRPNTRYSFTAKVRSTADAYWFPGADGSLGSVGATAGQFVPANTSQWITWGFTTDTDVTGFFVMRVNGNAGFTSPLAVGAQLWLTDIHLSAPDLDVTPFTWGDSTHLGVSGDGHAWDQGAYTTGVTSGQAYVADHGADNTVDVGTSEMDVQVDVTISGTDADGLDVRVVDVNNYIRVDLYKDGGVARVIGVVGGSGIQVVNSAALGLVAGVPYRLRSITVGDWIRVFVDGTLVIDAHLDHTVMLTTGSAHRAGLHSDWSAHWDNFSVAAGNIARGVGSASGSLTVTLKLTAAGARHRDGIAFTSISPLIAPPAGTPGQGWEWNGRTRDGDVNLDLDPIADPDPPNRSPVILNTLTNHYPAPTIIDGRPYADADGNPWAPTDGEGTHGQWGRYRISIDSVPRTWVRGQQTLILDYSDEDPGGPTTLTIAFPSVTSWDELDTGDLVGLKTGAQIIVTKRNPDTTYGGDVWVGELGVETDTLIDAGSGGPATYLTFSCRGWWLVLDDFITLPRANPSPIEAELFIHQMAKSARIKGWPAHILRAPITGLRIPERGEYGSPLGSQTITNALKLMQRLDGTVYTIGWTSRFRLQIIERSWGGPPDFTFRVGQRGLSHTLTRDPAAAFTAIYGRGQYKNQAWENWQYPNAYNNPPAFPLPPGVVCGVNLFCAGSGATGLQPFSDELEALGWNIDSQDTYVASDFDTIEAYQDSIGVQVDGVIGPQTWNQTFQLGQNARVLADSYIRELWAVHAVQPYLLNSRGGIVGPNPAFDPNTWRRREKLVDYGVLDKPTARQSARIEGGRNKLPYFIGTVTARNIDPTQMPALDTYSGMNMRLDGHRGADRMLHVVKRDVITGMTVGGGQADRVVTWTVSEKPDDMMTLAQILARKQGVRDLVNNNRPHRRSSHRTPDWVPFDSESGAGIQTREAQFAGLWNVYWVPMGEAVDVNAVKLVADRPTQIAAAMFNQRITPAHLQTLPGLSNPSAGTTDPWAANTDALNALGIQWATGGPNAMQGYWPNDPGGTLTGVLADTSPWAFRTLHPPFGYLAVWTSVSCDIGGDPSDVDPYRAIFPAPEH